MKNYLIILLWAINPLVYAQETNVPASNLQLFQTAQKSKLLLPHSIHPDLAQLRMSQTGNKWRNMLGMNISLAQYENQHSIFSLRFNPFIELHDFNTNQDMSWELWRGHLGGNLYYTNKRLNQRIHRNFTAIIGLGYTHESQHVTNYHSYMNTFLTNTWWFNNANIRTFEYWEATLQLKQKIGSRWQAFAQSNYKYYPAPIAYPNANYDLKQGINQEIGIVFTANNHISFNLNYFGERIFNTFESNFTNQNLPYNYIDNWYHSPFTYNHIEGGIILKNKIPGSSQFNLFLGYFKGNGRGLDFIRTYNEWYGGIKILL